MDKSRRNLLAGGLVGAAGMMVTAITKGYNAEARAEVVTKDNMHQRPFDPADCFPLSPRRGQDVARKPERQENRLGQEELELEELVLDWERLQENRLGQEELELEELVLYWERLQEKLGELTIDQVAKNWSAQPPGIGRRAIQIPRATVPQARYLRLTDEEKAVPEPQIELLHRLCWGVPTWLSRNYLIATADCLAKRMDLVPREATITSKIDLLNPNGKPMPWTRIVTPVYTMDVDDGIDMRATAVMLLDTVVSIWTSWQEQIAATILVSEVEANSFGVNKPTIVRCQITPINFSVEREAYMMKFHGWNRGAGWASWAREGPLEKVEAARDHD